MAGELEKFVLQYTVELKDSIRRLEELQDKVEGVGKSGSDSGNALKGVFGDFKKELQPLYGEFSNIEGIIARLGYRIAWLAPILGGLALGVKSIIDVRKEYEAQRKLGFESGMTPFAIEQFQREANKASGGVVGAPAARDIIQKTSNLAFAAYTNPDVMSRESLVLSKLGTSAFGQGGGIKETSQILDEIGNKLRSVSQQTATAIGALAGFSADEVKALRNRNSQLKESTKISDEEAARMQRQQVALEAVRNATGSIQEDWRRIELIVGQHILPLFADLVKNAADTAENIQQMFQMLGDGWDDFVDRFMADLKHPFGGAEAKRQAFTERFINGIMRDNQRQTEKNIRDQERNAQETRNAQALFTRDINLFSSAVSTFAGVIDERQAWAAWAGEIGRAAGVGPTQGLAAMRTGVTESASYGPVNPTIYDQIYKEAAERYASAGVTEELLKAVTRVESGFNPNTVSESDAHGLMQIVSSNFKRLGITNPYDPRQNIMGGAQLLAEYMKAAGGDMNLALTMYHGGYDRSGWGPRTRAYPGKVMAAMQDTSAGYGDINANRPAGAAPYPVLTPGVDLSTVEVKRGHTAPVAGQSRENLQLRGLQEAIASYLNVPVQQVMQGGVTKGDVSFARKYLEMGTQRDYIKNMQLAETPGVRPNVAAEAMKNARLAAFQLQAFQKFGGSIEDKARPGGRDITVGQKEITINVNGAQDPRSTAYEIRDVLRQDDINDLNNMTAAPNKW